MFEVGAEILPQRMIAERANAPLGSTTYYFSSLAELDEEALRMRIHDTGIALETLKRSSPQCSKAIRLIASTY